QLSAQARGQDFSVNSIPRIVTRGECIQGRVISGSRYRDRALFDDSRTTRCRIPGDPGRAALPDQFPLAELATFNQLTKVSDLWRFIVSMRHRPVWGEPVNNLSLRRPWRQIREDLLSLTASLSRVHVIDPFGRKLRRSFSSGDSASRLRWHGLLHR